MNTSEQIAIKGRVPQKAYTTTLADLFESGDDLDVQESGTIDRLFDRQRILESVFPQFVLRQHRRVRRFPCIMKEAPTVKRRLNLCYQDTRIKLGIEEMLAATRSSDDPAETARGMLLFYRSLLRTSWHGLGMVWQQCTDNDLDALTYQLLNEFDRGRQKRLLEEGYAANANSIKVLAAYLREREWTAREFLSPQVFAGTVWWSDAPALPVARALEIDDFHILEAELRGGSKTLIFLFDDNGELVWDLMMIAMLLKVYSRLRVVAVVSTEVVANNANAVTVLRCLDHDLFRELRGNARFELFHEANVRSAIDPAFCSDELLSLIRSASVAVVKGASFFETTQELDVPAFYAFVVHGQDSETCTGLRRGDGVFVRVPRGRAGFVYGRATLVDLRAKW